MLEFKKERALECIINCRPIPRMYRSFIEGYIRKLVPAKCGFRVDLIEVIHENKSLGLQKGAFIFIDHHEAVKFYEQINFSKDIMKKLKFKKMYVVDNIVLAFLGGYKKISALADYIQQTLVTWPICCFAISITQKDLEQAVVDFNCDVYYEVYWDFNKLGKKFKKILLKQEEQMRKNMVELVEQEEEEPEEQFIPKAEQEEKICKTEQVKIKDDGLNYFVNDKDTAIQPEAKQLNKIKNFYQSKIYNTILVE